MTDSNSIYSDLPQGWKLSKIGEVFEIVTGNTPSKKEPENYGNFLPLIKPPELLNCVVNKAEDNLSEEGAKKARLLPENSILVSCIGNLGKIGINSCLTACNQQINAILPNESLFLSKFLFYQCQSSEFRRSLELLASATTVTIVNKTKFETIKIKLPPPTRTISHCRENRRIILRTRNPLPRHPTGIRAEKRLIRANLHQSSE